VGIPNARGQVGRCIDHCYMTVAGFLERLKNMKHVTTQQKQTFTHLCPLRFGRALEALSINRLYARGKRQSWYPWYDQAFAPRRWQGRSHGFAIPECGLDFSYTMTRRAVPITYERAELVDAALIFAWL